MSGLKSMFIPAQVLRERLKENASEISIFQGEILLIHPALHCHTAGKSWVLASNNRGRAGLVPETHVKKIKSTAFFASESYPQAKNSQNSLPPNKRNEKRKRVSSAATPLSDESTDESQLRQSSHTNASIVVPSLQLVFDLRTMLHRCNGSQTFQGICYWLQLAGNDMEISVSQLSSLKCWLHELVKGLSIKYIKLAEPTPRNSMENVTNQADLHDQICFVESIARIHREIALQPLVVARLIRLLCMEAPGKTDDERKIVLASLLQLSKTMKSPSKPETKRGRLNCNLSPENWNLQNQKSAFVSLRDANLQKKPLIKRDLSSTGFSPEGHLRPLSPDSPIHFKYR